MKTIRSYFIILFVVVCTAAPVGAQTYDWEEQAPAATPPARLIFGYAYDSDTNQTVIFGGDNGMAGTHSDTWTYDGSDWTQANPATTPNPRYGHVMEYDANNSETVLFGGRVGVGNSNQTWTYNGTTWTLEAPATSPTGASFGAMAYHAANNTIVMFGGLDGGATAQGTTWVWNGTDWTNAMPANSPPARYLAGMAYDSDRGRTVLFGGYENAGRTTFDDVWEWNGTNWSEITPATGTGNPSARYSHGMSFDSVLGKVVVFGGFDDANLLGDTWYWDGNDWEAQSPANSPDARSDHMQVYDSTDGSTVVYGGLIDAATADDTWEYGVAASPSPSQSPAPTPSNSPAPTPSNSPAPTPSNSPAPTPSNSPAPTPSLSPTFAPTPSTSPAPVVKPVVEITKQSVAGVTRKDNGNLLVNVLFEGTATSTFSSVTRVQWAKKKTRDGELDLNFKAVDSLENSSFSTLVQKELKKGRQSMNVVAFFRAFDENGERSQRVESSAMVNRAELSISEPTPPTVIISSKEIVARKKKKDGSVIVTARFGGSATDNDSVSNVEFSASSGGNKASRSTFKNVDTFDANTWTTDVSRELAKGEKSTTLKFKVRAVDSEGTKSEVVSDSIKLKRKDANVTPPFLNITIDSADFTVEEEDGVFGTITTSASGTIENPEEAELIKQYCKIVHRISGGRGGKKGKRKKRSIKANFVIAEDGASWSIFIVTRVSKLFDFNKARSILTCYIDAEAIVETGKTPGSQVKISKKYTYSKDDPAPSPSLVPSPSPSPGSSPSPTPSPESSPSPTPSVGASPSATPSLSPFRR